MGDAPPSDKYTYIFIRIREEITLLEQKKVPGLGSPARQLRRCFSSAGTSRRSAGGRVLRAGRAPHPPALGGRPHPKSLRRTKPRPRRLPASAERISRPLRARGRKVPLLWWGRGTHPSQRQGTARLPPKPCEQRFFNCDLLPYTRNLLIERLFFFLSIFKDPFFEG